MGDACRPCARHDVKLAEICHTMRSFIVDLTKKTILNSANKECLR